MWVREGSLTSVTIYVDNDDDDGLLYTNIIAIAILECVLSIL